MLWDMPHPVVTGIGQLKEQQELHQSSLLVAELLGCTAEKQELEPEQGLEQGP